MNKYLAPQIVVSRFGLGDTIAAAAVSVADPTYAAQNLNEYMFGASVGAGRTTTVKMQSIMEFNK